MEIWGGAVRQSGGAVIHWSRRLENAVETVKPDLLDLVAYYENPSATSYRPPNTTILGVTLIYPATLEEQLALLHEWDFGHDSHSDPATGLSEVGMNNPERVMQRRNAASRFITEMWNSSPLTLTRIGDYSLSLQFNEAPSSAQADMWAMRTWEHFRSNYMREDWYVEAMARDNSLANCKRLARKFGRFYLGALV